MPLVDITNGVEKGFAVLKDKTGVAQFLLIPTARIGGIEDPALLGARRNELLGSRVAGPVIC